MARRLYIAAVLWRPVILRGGLWIIIAMLEAVRTERKLITPERLAQWSTWDTVDCAVGILLPAFLTWRTFLDQTLARHREKLAVGRGTALPE